MATVGTLAERLRNLRIKYTEQISGAERAYEEALARNKENTAKIKRADYAAKYKERFLSLAESCKLIYGQIEQIEESTHGLKFKTSEYMKSVSAERFEAARLNTYFDELVKRCLSCAKELEKDKPFADYEQDLKNFCVLYATAKYISANADSLLAKSGIPEEERAADLAAASAELKEIKEKRARETDLVNLPCYGEMSALVGEVKSSSTKIKSDMLGSDSFYYDKSYKYLLGFWKDKIAPEDVEFAQKVMGLTPSELSSQPIYFDPQSGVNNIIINVRGADFKSGKYLDIVKRLYFTIMSRLRKNSLKFSSVACERVSKGAVKIFHNTIFNTFDKGKPLAQSLYVDGNCVDDKDGVRNLLVAHADKNTDVETNLRGRNVYDYNRSAEEDPVVLRMLYIDCYPSGFSSTYGAGYDDLWQLLYYNVNSGEFVIVTQNVDGEFDEKLKMLDASDEDLHSLVIDYTDPKNPTVNGRAAILDTALPEFQEWDFWDKLVVYYSQKETYSTKEMLNDVDTSFKSVTDTSDGVIRVPIGKSGDKLMTLDFDKRSACHSFIYAPSGKGKTSFLHNLIISLCYNFSPEELEFYIADYKGELNMYASKEKRIPHVKYYLAQDPSADNERNAVNWIDMINMIEQVRADRQNEMSRLSAELNKTISDIVEYNRHSEKKLPYLFVLIDEWQAVLDLNSGNRAMQKNFSGVLNAILSLARSVGIVVILTGQKGLGSFGVAENNIKNFIYLSMPSSDEGRIHSDSKQTEEDKAYLSVEKEGRIILKSGDKIDRFRTAFAGSVSKDVKVEPVLIDMISDKYAGVKAEPVIAGGSVEPFYISQESLPAYGSMTEPVRTGGKIDKNIYPVYVGVTTSFARPVAVNFSYNKDYCGFMMRSGDSDRINLFLRSLCVSFLYKTAYGVKGANAKYAADGVKRRIKFFASKYNYDNDIGEIAGKYAPVGGQIEHFDVKNDLYGACKALMDLRKLYLKRKANAEEGEKCLPVLAVFHEPAWLQDFEALKIACNAPADAPAADDWEAKVSEAGLQKTIARIKDLPMYKKMTADELRKSALNMEVAKLKKNQGGTPPPAREKFSATDVEKAFKELYDNGNVYGIFIFAASDSAFSLSSMRSKLSAKEGLNKNVVFGCYSEALSGFGTGGKDIADASDVCYVGPENIKTRIYQIELESDKAFMRDLARKIEE